MKKSISILFFSLVLCYIGSFDAVALQEDCPPGGLANVYCPYWDIHYEVESGFWPWSDPTITISCDTGGEFQCESR